VCASLLNLYIIEFPGHRWGDATTFESYAWKLANLRWGTFLDSLQIGDPYYTYGWIVGLIYRIVGHAVMVPHVLNAFLGALVVLYIYKTTRILWSETAAIRATWVAALFPSFLHYHSILLREVWVALGFTLSVYFFSSYLCRSRSLSDALLSLLAMGVATIFHGGMIAGLAGLMLYFFWRCIQLWGDLMLRTTGAQRTEFTAATLLVGITFPLLVYGLVAGISINKIGSLHRLAQPDVFVERAIQVAQSRTHGGARYPSILSLQRASDVVVKTVPRTIYFLFSPFPWDVRKPVHAAALIDSLIYMLLFYHIFAGWRDISAENKYLVAVLLVPLVIAFSIGSSNFGAAMRHRAKVVPLVICIFPVFPVIRMFRNK